MNNLQRFGGIAALIDGLTYIFGFVLLLTVLAPMGFGSDTVDASKVLAFAAENPLVLPIWNLTIYVVNGLFLAVLAVALYQRVKIDVPTLAAPAAAIGLIWAALVIGAGMVANVGLEEALRVYANDPEGAAAFWQIMHTVELGLGGGNEIVGGVWALLLGLIMLRTDTLPNALGYFSLLIGVSGLSTVVTPISEVTGAVFGLGYIAWFFWTGIVLLRK